MHCLKLRRTAGRGQRLGALRGEDPRGQTVSSRQAPLRDPPGQGGEGGEGSAMAGAAGDPGPRPLAAAGSPSWHTLQPGWCSGHSSSPQPLAPFPPEGTHSSGGHTRGAQHPSRPCCPGARSPQLLPTPPTQGPKLPSPEDTDRKSP